MDHVEQVLVGLTEQEGMFHPYLYLYICYFKRLLYITSKPSLSLTEQSEGEKQNLKTEEEGTKTNKIFPCRFLVPIEHK